jgi:hypothetical protein
MSYLVEYAPESFVDLENQLQQYAIALLKKSIG